MDKYVIALYIRLSVDDKKSDSLSIENQKNLLYSYVSNMKEYEDAEILEFIDNGYSGTNFERPAVQEILNLVETSKVDCIIVKDFSRFGRNSLEVGYFTEKVFPMYNIRFVSISERFDSLRNKSDTGGIGVAFQYLVNEHYSKDLSKKVKTSVYSKMKNGEFKVSQCAFGFKKDENGKLIIDEEAAEIVKLIFELALEVDRITDLVIALNERGILTPSQYRNKNNSKLHSNAKNIQFWTVQAVKKVLKNEFYIGVFIGRRFKTLEVGGASVPNNNENEHIRIEDNHPKIIDDDTFNKVQQIIVTGKTQPYVKNDYPLRSKVKCGVCNHAMARVNKVKSYKCKYTLNVEGYSCKGLKILESQLENIVLTIIKKQAELILAIECNETLVLDMSSASINECKEKIIDIEKKKMNFYEMFIRQEISIEEYKEKTFDIDKRLIEFNSILKSILVKKELDNSKSNLVTLCENALSKNELTRGLVEELIENIFVYPDEKIEILWKVKEFII